MRYQKLTMTYRIARSERAPLIFIFLLSGEYISLGMKFIFSYHCSDIFRFGFILPYTAKKSFKNSFNNSAE